MNSNIPRSMIGKLSEKDVLKLTLEQWTWMKKNKATKADYLKWKGYKKIKNSSYYLKYDCFCCQYTIGTGKPFVQVKCKICPLYKNFYNENDRWIGATCEGSFNPWEDYGSHAHGSAGPKWNFQVCMAVDAMINFIEERIEEIEERDEAKRRIIDYEKNNG